MAEPDEDVIAPPPIRQRGAGELPANQFGELVKVGFQLGLGIALAFLVVSGLLWMLAMILVAGAVT